MADIALNTYQIEFFVGGVWNPGNLVKMHPRHFKFYLEFLNGQRPMIAPNGRKKIYRKQHRCLPTRLRRVEPDWSHEDGYWVFDGMSQEYVSLTTHARLMPRRRRLGE